MKHYILAKFTEGTNTAALVEPGTTLIDVGTDHAYLPLHLLLAGQVVPPVWATDVNAGPLDRARRSAAACGAADKLIFALTDGLKGLDPACAETVVIAGMGGENIADITTHDITFHPQFIGYR